MVPDSKIDREYEAYAKDVAASRKVSAYQYSAGHGPQSHIFSDRFEWPKGQTTYNDDWRLVATDLADDFHSNHDGWESQWPINIRIYKDSECMWSGDVDREMEPCFYVV